MSEKESENDRQRENDEKDRENIIYWRIFWRVCAAQCSILGIRERFLSKKGIREQVIAKKVTRAQYLAQKGNLRPHIPILATCGSFC